MNLIYADVTRYFPKAERGWENPALGAPSERPLDLIADAERGIAFLFARRGDARVDLPPTRSQLCVWPYW